MSRFGLVFFLFSASIYAEEAPILAIVSDKDVDRFPDHTVAPKYPRKARRDRIEGAVQVCFEVDRKGRPRRVAVRSSSNRAFERPSVRAVKESTFRPLAEDETPSGIKSCRTFIFSLHPAEPDS